MKMNIQEKNLKIKDVSRRSDKIDLDLVFPTPFNPPIRTANKTGDIKELSNDISENGQLEPVHVVEMSDRTFQVVDGNRRRAAMLMAGFTKINAIVYSPNPSTDPNVVVRRLFVDLNDDKRRLANRDMTEVGLLGGPIFNSVVKSTVKFLGELFPNGIPAIVKQNAGATPVGIAKRIVAYTSPHLKAGSDSYKNCVANTLLWVIRNKQQQKATAYMRNQFSTSRLRTAVENNKLTPGMTP